MKKRKKKSRKKRKEKRPQKRRDRDRRWVNGREEKKDEMDDE
jgi:hypothetical protein